MTYPGKVVKVNLTDFTHVATLTLNKEENVLLTSVVSGDYAYFA